MFGSASRGIPAVLRRNYLDDFGGGRGVASLDQAAFVAAAAAGLEVRLRRNTTYYMTGGVTPASGFRLIGENGSRVVPVTGSGNFNSFSGLAANRNSVLSRMFMLTADGGEFCFEDVFIEYDDDGGSAVQPILAPFYAANSNVIWGGVRVEGLRACQGVINLNGMRSYEIDGCRFIAPGFMQENPDGGGASQIYSDIGTTYSPSGIVFEDTGSKWSNAGVITGTTILGFDRDATGEGAGQGDGITLGGNPSTFSLRSGDTEGHRISDCVIGGGGEGIDCFQSGVHISSTTIRDCSGFGIVGKHGAQRMLVTNPNITGYGQAGVVMSGSSTAGQHCRDNMIIGGYIGDADPTSGDCAAIRLDENGGGASSTVANFRVIGTTIKSVTGCDYQIRSNVSSSGAGVLTDATRNRFIDIQEIGTYDVAQVLDATENVVRVDTSVKQAARTAGSATTSVTNSTTYAADSDNQQIIAMQSYAARDAGETLRTLFTMFFRGAGRGVGSWAGQLLIRFFSGSSGTYRDHVLKYEGLLLGSGGKVYVGADAVVGARVVDADLADTDAMGSSTLTDNSGGTPDTTIAVIGATYSQAEVGDAVASLAAQVNALRADNAAQKTALDAALTTIRSHGLGAVS